MRIPGLNDQQMIDTSIAGIIIVIIEYLVNISKRRAFWSLNEDILKITILTTNTPYRSRKIRRIRACTQKRPQRKQDQYATTHMPHMDRETERICAPEGCHDMSIIQAQPSNLGKDQESELKVYAAQVGCEQCKGSNYTKDCPLKEEGKNLEEACYTQFGGPFQGGGYRAAALGFYQRNNVNPSYQERRKYMEDTLSKFMSESAKRHEENSNLIKEIRASRMLPFKTRSIF
ncbi:hypothetical protein Tco_1555531 [Tanacetum coccineum]